MKVFGIMQSIEGMMDHSALYFLFTLKEVLTDQCASLLEIMRMWKGHRVQIPLDVGRSKRASADIRLDLPADWSPTSTSSGKTATWETPRS